MRYRKVSILIATVVFGMISTNAQNKSIAESPKSDMAVVAAPPEKRIVWENHRLRAANIRYQLDALQKQAADEDKAADAELEAMQKAVGDKYAPRISSTTGQLEFYLKEVPASISADIPKSKSTKKVVEKTSEKPKQ